MRDPVLLKFKRFTKKAGLKTLWNELKTLFSFPDQDNSKVFVAHVLIPDQFI